MPMNLAMIFHLFRRNSPHIASLVCPSWPRPRLIGQAGGGARPGGFEVARGKWRLYGECQWILAKVGKQRAQETDGDNPLLNSAHAPHRVTPGVARSSSPRRSSPGGLERRRCPGEAAAWTVACNIQPQVPDALLHIARGRGLSALSPFAHASPVLPASQWWPFSPLSVGPRPRRQPCLFTPGLFWTVVRP